MRSKVLFPQPLGPMMLTNSPSSMVNDTRSSTGVPTTPENSGTDSTTWSIGDQPPLGRKALV